MATYMMFGRYTAEGIRDISAARTEKAEDFNKGSRRKNKSWICAAG